MTQPAPALTPFETQGAALAEAARRWPEAEALAFPLAPARTSFAAWDRDATALARALLDLGLVPGDALALLAENRLEWPVVQLAAARAGLVLVPLNTHSRQEDLSYALTRAACRAVVLSPRFRSNAYLDMVQALRPPGLRHVIVLDPVPGLPDVAGLIRAGAASARALPAVAAADVAMLLFTSGTTGFPKGALLSHRAILGNAFGTAGRLGIGPGDRWTSIIPLFHCAGCIMNLLGCLQTGAAYVGVPAFDPVDMFRTIEAERCTALSGVPTSYLAMLDHPRRGAFDLSSLRTGTCGGADADPDLLRRCAEAFPQPGLCQVYGQTESGTLVACPAADDPARFETVGPPLPGYTVRITAADEEGRVLPPGQVGQVEARGPMVMDGYHQDPAATAETLTPDGWLRTGDLGTLRPDGHLVMAGGRLRDMIIRGGENIYPVEIERALADHPSVVECAVFGVPDAYYGEVVAVAARLRAPATRAGLAAFLEGRIARFKAPALAFAVDAFPLTASGKIRKTALRAMAADGTLARLPDGPA